MNDNQLDQRVECAFERLVPDVLDSVLSDCCEEKGNVIAIRHTGKKHFWRTAVGIAAALVLVLGSTAGAVGYKAAHTPASVISLDVNPSIEIAVNKNEKVIAVTPKNEDGKTVIGDMDFEGSSLDVAVNALIGSMLKNGYISDLANSILVSVDSRDPADAAAIQLKVSSEIDDLLNSDGSTGSVLSQVIVPDKDLRSVADEHGITLGKAQLVRRIVDKDPRYTFDELVKLNINDLNLILSTGGLRLENVNSVGTASEKKYIGQESAVTSAVNHAGLDISIVDLIKVEFDYEDGHMVYELKFGSGDAKYDYDIDAVTGDVVSGSREEAPDAEDTAEGHGKAWENWAEQFGDNWEAWAEQYGDNWEAWADKYGNDWEAWAENYGDNWEAWGESYGEAWEHRGEIIGDSWENWGENYGEAWENWGEQYGADWERWGKKYGAAWESWAEALFDF